MDELPPRPRVTRERELANQVGRKEKRKLRAQRHRDQSIWFGLGAFGVIGWSVAVPTLVGIALGLWLDANFPERISWTLTFLVAGLLVGCVTAWYWLNLEGRVIERKDANAPDKEQEND